MTPHEIEVGNRRLLKLAEYLEALPRGQYDQESNGPDGPRCAAAHTFDMPQYKRFCTVRTASRAASNSSFGLSNFYKLDLGNGCNPDWYLLFGADGCSQKDGRPARTGKQAAKFIRQFVSNRRAPK